MHNAEGIIRCIAYDPQDGSLVWIARPSEDFQCDRAWASWNARFAGKPALNSTNDKGYRAGRLMGGYLLAHRAAHVIMTGGYPEADIDHINGNRKDNRWANLRCVSRMQNTKNGFMRANNTSGVTGVSWDKKSKAWKAQLGRWIIGNFADMADAILARSLAMELDGGYSARHGKSKG